MNIKTEQKPVEQTATLTLDGRFDAHETADFRDHYNKLETEGISNFTVHLGKVEFVDSTALAELVRGMKRARERRGDLTLASPSDPVRVILELTKLDAAFQIT